MRIDDAEEPSGVAAVRVAADDIMEVTMVDDPEAYGVRIRFDDVAAACHAWSLGLVAWHRNQRPDRWAEHPTAPDGLGLPTNELVTGLVAAALYATVRAEGLDSATDGSLVHGAPLEPPLNLLQDSVRYRIPRDLLAPISVTDDHPSAAVVTALSTLFDGYDTKANRRQNKVLRPAQKVLLDHLGEVPGPRWEGASSKDVLGLLLGGGFVPTVAHRITAVTDEGTAQAAYGKRHHP
ncbi:hypothetical protein [Streptomyces violascens]|uniref:hypothetical protein n=1 Tax=Streptomyces violascens TaxID=67381 RepID=UPI001673545A|nr:hypothetical protein [Streptomyces violascens]GGU52856.1 hypothetical protein GCM10010289_86230 [Streptomyces violascens]